MQEESETLRLVLTAEQTSSIPVGRHYFAVVTQGSWPDAVGRMVAHLIPCDHGTAIEASEVALGDRKAGKRHAGAGAPPYSGVPEKQGGKCGASPGKQ